jgi:carbamoyltransferase
MRDEERRATGCASLIKSAVVLVLGISGLYHDAAAALVKDGVVVAAAQEERFSGVKNDASLPVRAGRYCLREAMARPEDLDAIVFYEKPFRKFERILVTQLREFPRSCGAFVRATAAWLGDKLWIRGTIADAFGVAPSRVLFTEHHEAHAASAYLASPFDEAAVLTIDGVGEWTTTATWRGSGGALELLSETRFPHSLGLLYSALTAYLGFEVNEGEQKVMALAAFGTPRFKEAIESLIAWDDDGGFILDTRAFRYAFDPDKSFGALLVQKLGEPRTPGAAIDLSGADRRFADVAASLQVVLEDGVLRLARALHRRVPSPNLCLAGGVALNVVATARLLREGPFSNVYVQPSPGDSGGAMGAALLAANLLSSAPRTPLRHAFLGEGPGLELPAGGRDVASDDDVAEEAAKLLAAGKTVGFVQGRFEWGPRALGHRSLLADPRDRSMQEKINATIKRREGFRPFAPATPRRAATTYFRVPKGGAAPARYMLLATEATDAGKAACPAALHVDGSARLQIVDPDVDPLFHATLERFGERTGAPILLNTSLNLRGRPIVRGGLMAHDLWRRSPLDVLIVGRRIYVKE